MRFAAWKIIVLSRYNELRMKYTSQTRQGWGGVQWVIEIKFFKYQL